MPTFEVKVPVGANQIWMRKQIREAVAEATRRGKLRPNSVDSITGENSGDNLGPGTPIIHFDQWERRRRGQADSSRAAAARTRTRSTRCRPSSIISAAPIARSKACASASSTRCGRRRARAAAPAPSASASAATARPATCTPRSSCSARSTTRIPIRGSPRSKNDHGRGQPARRRPDGIRRQDVAHRLQDRRAESPAGQLLRVDRLRLLGVPPPRRPPRRDDRRDQRVAVSRSAQSAASHADAGSGPPGSRDRPRGRLARRSDEDDPLAEGRRRRARLRPRLHRARRGPRAPDEARAAGRSARRRALSLRSGRREGRRRLARHRRGTDHEHPRGAVSGRDPQALRRPRRDRQGRHGREDARRR